MRLIFIARNPSLRLLMPLTIQYIFNGFLQILMQIFKLLVTCWDNMLLVLLIVCTRIELKYCFKA